MRRPELDYILSTMLDAAPEVSDLLFTVDKPLQVEAAGELVPVALDPPIERLTPLKTKMSALDQDEKNKWNHKALLRSCPCNSANTVMDKARFLINIFSQRTNFSTVLHKKNKKIQPEDHT